jgi:hypothetical protein
MGISAEPMTLVEFTLEDVPRRHASHDRGVGFDKIRWLAAPRRSDERRRLDRGRSKEHSTPYPQSQRGRGARCRQRAGVCGAWRRTRLEIVAALRGGRCRSHDSAGAGVTVRRSPSTSTRCRRRGCQNVKVDANRSGARDAAAGSSAALPRSDLRISGMSRSIG